MGSIPGAILSGLFGYHDAPVLGEVLAWAAVLFVTLWFFLRPAPSRPVAPRAKEA